MLFLQYASWIELLGGGPFIVLRLRAWYKSDIYHNYSEDIPRISSATVAPWE